MKRENLKRAEEIDKKMRELERLQGDLDYHSTTTWTPDVSFHLAREVTIYSGEFESEICAFRVMIENSINDKIRQLTEEMEAL